MKKSLMYRHKIIEINDENISMEDIIYIKGNLAINVESSVFKYRDLIALSNEEDIPKESTIIEADLTVKDDNNDSSFFKSYYVTGGIALINGRTFGIPPVDSVYSYFEKDMENLHRLIKGANHYDKDLSQVLYRHVFIGAIASLEATLCNIFAGWVFSRRERLREYITSQRSKTIALSDVVKASNDIEYWAYIDIQNKLYHRFDDVKNLYKNAKIKFPPIQEIVKFISVRHDLVHRNGKDKTGNAIFLSAEKINWIDDSLNVNCISELFKTEKKFINDIFSEISEKI